MRTSSIPTCSPLYAHDRQQVFEEVESLAVTAAIEVFHHFRLERNCATTFVKVWNSAGVSANTQS